MPIRVAFLVLFSTVLCAQQGTESRPRQPIELPAADQAKPIADEAPILVEVLREGDDASDHKRNPLRTWRVGMDARTYSVVDGVLESGFAAALRSRMTPKSALLIRADAKAPYVLIQRVLETAADAKLSRIFFETRSSSATPVALFCTLPRDDDRPDPEGLPDIRLLVGLKKGSVVRAFDINPRPIPTGPAGDAALEGMLRTKYEDYRKLWKTEIPVVVEGADLVPWEHCVDLVNLARRIGAQRIEFGASPPPEPPETPAAKPDGKPPERPDPTLPDVEPSEGELTSRPTAEITPPKSTSAVAFEEPNPIEVWISRDESGTTSSRPFADWRWQIRNRVYAFDAPGWKGMTINLARRGGALFAAESSRTLLIRADARAPYGMVQKTLEAASLARIYKIHFCAVRDPAVAREALKTWLPVARTRDENDVPNAIHDEIRIVMSWNSQMNKLERLFGQTVCPTTPEGDAKLESLLRASDQDYRAQGKSAPLIIDAGPKVPVQHIVDVLDLAAKVGIERVEFGSGTAMK